MGATSQGWNSTNITEHSFSKTHRLSWWKCLFLMGLFCGKCNSSWRMFCKCGAASQGSSGVVELFEHRSGATECSFSKTRRLSWLKCLFFEVDSSGNCDSRRRTFSKWVQPRKAGITPISLSIHFPKYTTYHNKNVFFEVNSSGEI